MSKKVLVLYSKNHINFGSDFAPLGPLYIVSFLRDNGIQVDFYDLNYLKKSESTFFSEIINENYTHIGFSCTISNFRNVLINAKQFKLLRNDIKIILGGALPSSSPEYFQKYWFIDSIIVGEGEHTFYQYIKNGDKSEGMYVRKGENYVYTGNRELISDLDTLPFPALDLVNIKDYTQTFKKSKPLSTIMTSRGCPFHCGFCFHGLFGYKWRPRSPNNVIKEIKWQVKEFGIRELCIFDDNFALKKERAQKICEAMVRDNFNLDIQLPNGLRYDILDFETLKTMKKAGLWYVGLAPESGDKEVLKILNKMTSFKKLAQVVRWCKDLDIYTKFFLIFGFPFETKEAIYNSISLLRNIKPDSIALHLYNPFPKTPLVEKYNYEVEIFSGYFSKTENHFLNKIIRQLYIQYYTSPKKVLRLIKKIGIINYLGLLKFSIFTSFNYV